MREGTAYTQAESTTASRIGVCSMVSASGQGAMEPAGCSQQILSLLLPNGGILGYSLKSFPFCELTPGANGSSDGTFYGNYYSALLDAA